MTKLLITYIKLRKPLSKEGLFSNFSTFPKKSVAAGLLSLSLFGCGDFFEPRIKEICSTHSEMCLDLNLDARCSYEKAEIIRLRYYHQDDKSDAYKYPLLLAFEDYLVCVEDAQHIEHIKRKGKEATRLKGVITAHKELKRLSQETQDSLDPYLSYYHWTRFNDKAALHRFERYTASKNVEDPELLIALASIQIKTDFKRTVETLYRALSLYKDSDDIDTDVYQSLATLALDMENYRMAYVWLGVSEYFNEDIPATRRTQLGQKFNLPVEILDNISEEIVSSLERGTFNAKSLQLDRL